MFITILAEPRSGSTNLANWFYFNKNFTTLFLPSDKTSKWYKNEYPKDYKYNTPHLLVKEDYYQHKIYDDLIDASNKVILLYRENIEEQIESWINAKKTNNWHNQWVSNNIKNNNENIFFTELKNKFKEEFLTKNYFKISYEELYYNNGLQKLIDYLSLDCVKNENFPFGKKYRIDSAPDKLI
jgi:LPS sulfotransferase NodH